MLQCVHWISYLAYILQLCPLHVTWRILRVQPLSQSYTCTSQKTRLACISVRTHTKRNKNGHMLNHLCCYEFFNLHVHNKLCHVATEPKYTFVYIIHVSILLLGKICALCAAAFIRHGVISRNWLVTAINATCSLTRT